MTYLTECAKTIVTDGSLLSQVFEVNLASYEGFKCRYVYI